MSWIHLQTKESGKIVGCGTYLTTGDELIDDALSCVGEVSELSLPNDQSVGVGHGEAQLEAKHAVL